MKYKLPNKLGIRILMLLLGMFFIALGVAFSTKSGLGVSPSAAIPYVLSGVTPLSMGVLTTILNCLMIVAQIVMLRKDYKPIQLLQLVVVFVFGYFTDLTLFLVSGIELNNYFLRLLFCVVSCFVMGLGVFLEVKANLITMSSEGAISAFTKLFHTDFGKTKMGLDSSFVVIGVVLSLIFTHSIVGIREGTIIAAIIVGMTVQFYNKCFGFLSRWLNGEAEPTLESVAENCPLVITIEREFGSGGHEIGKRLAEELGIPFYDQEIIAKTAAKSGYAVEQVADTEERLPNALIYTAYHQSYAAAHNMATQDAIFAAQSKVIKELATSDSCVIVGRLGSYILANRANTYDVFIAGDTTARAKQISEKLGMPFSMANTLVKKEDHARKQYCEHFTGKQWGLAWHYSMTLDSSECDDQDCVNLIKQGIAMSGKLENRKI